jgi:hypothetical protein
MAEGTRRTIAPPESYAVEVVGKLSRREVEALVLEIKGLARRHHLTVTGLQRRPVPREDPA